MKKIALRMLNALLCMQKDLEQDNGHASDLDRRKSGILSVKNSPQGEWDTMAEKMMLEFGESGHPVFRATSPLSRGQLKSKSRGKLSIHYCADQETITTVFRTIISVHQLSIYGAVSDVCEEYSACQARTGRPVLAGQSDPLFASANLLIMTLRPSIEIPAQENSLQKHKERVENLPQQDRVI